MMEKEKENDNGIYVDIRFIYIYTQRYIDRYIDRYICVCRSYTQINIYMCVDLSYGVKHVDVKHVDGQSKQ